MATGDGPSNVNPTIGIAESETTINWNEFFDLENAALAQDPLASLDQQHSASLSATLYSPGAQYASLEAAMVGEEAALSGTIQYPMHQYWSEIAVGNYILLMAAQLTNQAAASRE